MGRHTSHANGLATMSRLSGSDRYATARAVSQALYPATDSADAVVVVSGENFPDALAASPLAYTLNAPILLTKPSAISAATLNEIKRVLTNGAPVYIVGGTSAVSTSVKSTIESNGFPVTRIAGADRIATALAVANQLSPTSPLNVFIVNSTSFADGVSASSPAAKNRYPILLNPTSSLDSSVKSYLDAHTLQNVYIVGGTAAISSGVSASLTTLYDDADTDITRISGIDRYATSAALARTFYAGGTSPTKLIFANGLRYPDALVGGLFAAEKSGPLLLTDTNSVFADATDYLIDYVPQITSGYLIGGTSVEGTTNETVLTNLIQTGDTMNTIAAAGDIACDTTDGNYNGGSGNANGCHMEATATLVTALNPDAVLALGDLQYESGVLAKFNISYQNSWGAFKASTYPVPGNHEYNTADAAGYYDYFNGVGNPTGQAGDRTKGYYSTDIGTWHIVALNTNCSSIGGCDSLSAQHTWLQSDLASNTSTCTLAFWHQPRFSSGSHGNDSQYATFWNDLAADSADVVLNGHDHIYERFEKQTPSQVVSDTGMREFVIGTGGKNLTTITSAGTNSAVRLTSAYGVIFMRLYDWGYTWKFVDEDDNILDSGSDICS